MYVYMCMCVCMYVYMFFCYFFVTLLVTFWTPLGLLFGHFLGHFSVTFWSFLRSQIPSKILTEKWCFGCKRHEPKGTKSIGFTAARSKIAESARVVYGATSSPPFLQTSYPFLKKKQHRRACNVHRTSASRHPPTCRRVTGVLQGKVS